jgi:Endonuclease/Exonuclease/phosphatase family
LEETRSRQNDEGERLRYGGYARYRRTAEAMTCHARLDAILTADGDAAGDGPGTGTDTPVIFMGDLNDEPLAATTQIIIHGPGGSEIDFCPHSGFQQGDTGDGWRMWNLYRLLPTEGPNYTRIYRGRGELIDHMFASHRLVNPDNLPMVEVVAATPLPSIDDQPASATALPSEHAAVVATFEV